MLQKIQLSLWEYFKPKRKPIRTKVRRRISNKRSDQELQRLWLRIRSEWFPEKPEIDRYFIDWSKRPQKRTLASCNIESKRVIVARELNYPKHKIWLEPLLYHEMCHAALGYVKKDNYRSWHGEEFKALERKHPNIKELDRWIKDGGWQTAVRSDRSKRAALARKR